MNPLVTDLLFLATQLATTALNAWSRRAARASARRAAELLLTGSIAWLGFRFQSQSVTQAWRVLLPLGVVAGMLGFGLAVRLAPRMRAAHGVRALSDDRRWVAAVYAPWLALLTLGCGYWVTHSPLTRASVGARLELVCGMWAAGALGGALAAWFEHRLRATRLGA